MPDLWKLVRMSSSRCPNNRKPATKPDESDSKKKTVGVPESELPSVVRTPKLCTVPTGSNIEVTPPFVIEIECGKITYKVDDLEPTTYDHIKRNIYKIKQKKGAHVDVSGCTTCESDICPAHCPCRDILVCCTNACKCSENCTNRPSQWKEKKVEVVKIQHCGLGVKALEFIDKDDFVIEYVGEVIDDATRDKRFWEMKKNGITKSYVVKVKKDINVDAQSKGNVSRFINHSCDPNCVMKEWDGEGETRLPIFATKPIKLGEEITLNYRYEAYGELEVCRCGASNCRRYIGTKR